MRMLYPKISYVTPVYNQVEFIEQTILSVINQDYPNFEYIIVDGGSTDGTLEIIKKFENQLFKVISEPDNGMYDALGKGFKISSGEIMGWINSDDILLPGAFSNMARLFRDLPEVSWIQGLNCYIDLEGFLIKTHPPQRFSFVKFINGEFKWIQQESTFWRRSLWERAGGKVDYNLKLAGDFELWFRFFQITKLYNTTLPIGAWRKREGQISGTQMENYLKEAYNKINGYQIDEQLKGRLEKVRFYDEIITTLEKLRVFNTEPFLKRRNEACNLGKIEIVYSNDKQKFIVQ